MLYLYDEHPGEIGSRPRLVEVVGFLLLNAVVTGHPKALAVIGLKVGIGWLSPESTKIVREVPVVDDQEEVVGILTQSDVFRAFMHITGILQGGVQFALRLEDKPGLIKEVVDLLRSKGARFVSLLTSYTSAQEGYRDIYLRVKNLSPEAIEAAEKELAIPHEVLYVKQEGD